MARRLARIALLVLAVMCTAAAAAVLARERLLEALLERALAARGIAVARLEVVEAGPYRAVVEDLRLGEEREIVIASLVAHYAPSTLIRGRIDSLAVEDAALRLDATGRRPVLGTLQPALESGGGAPAVVPVGVVMLDGVRLEVTTPLGALRAEMAGEMKPGAAGELDAELDYTVQGAPGRLTGALAVSRSPSGEVSGTARIGDGSLALGALELASLGGEIAFAAGGAEAPTVDAKLSSSRVTAAGERGGRLSLELEARSGSVELDADLRSGAGHWSVRTHATVEDYLGAGRASLEMDASADAAASRFELLGIPAPEGGSATASLRAQASIGELVSDGVAWPVPRSRLEKLAGSGELSLTIRDLAYARRVDAVQARLEFDVNIDDGEVAMHLRRGGELRAGGISEQWLARLGVPAFASAALADGASVSLAEGDAHGTHLLLSLAGGEPSFEIRGDAALTARRGGKAGIAARIRGTLAEEGRVADLAVDDLRVSIGDLALPGALLSSVIVEGSLAGEPRHLEGEVDVALALHRVSAGPVSARGVEARLPASLSLEPGDVRLESTGGGVVDASGIAHAGGSRVASLHATLESANMRARLAPEGAASVAHRVALSVDTFEAILAGDGEAGLVVEASANQAVLEGRLVRDAPYRPSLAVAGARVALPRHEVAAERLSGSLDLAAAGRPLAVLRAESVRSTAPSPGFAPLRVRGEVERDGAALALTAAARTHGDVAVLEVRARHLPETGTGEATVSLGPLRFSSDGLQPVALLPALRRLKAVSGEIEGGSKLTWQGGARDGTAALRLRDIGFQADAGDVRGLELDFELDGLVPPASPPGQRLAVRRVDAGVPVHDVDVRFGIEGGERPRLVIASARLGVSGGRLALGETVLDPGEERQELTIEVNGLDLAEALAIVDVEGLSGTGKLSGEIPIRVGVDSLAVDGGRLAAAGPGVLRFASERASRVLSAAGEQLDLLLRALENFHYEELTIELDKPVGEDATVALSVLGANPDVLDGHPFRLNVNVEGRTGKVLAAVAEIYGLSNRLLRRAWMLGR